MKLVCDLYALDRIWKDIGTYRNVDYVAPNKAKVLQTSKLISNFKISNDGQASVEEINFTIMMIYHRDENKHLI